MGEIFDTTKTPVAAAAAALGDEYVSARDNFVTLAHSEVAAAAADCGSGGGSRWRRRKRRRGEGWRETQERCGRRGRCCSFVRL